MNRPKVIRLNAETFSIKPVERELLAKINAEIIEVENSEDCDCLADADAVMIISAYLRTPQVKQLSKCRIISRLGTGVDKIDIAQATAQGIYVTNVPEFATNEVADHTMALLLSAARRLKFHEEQMRQGIRPLGTNGLRRLAVQTLGIIGFGRIGQAVVHRALAFGLKVMVCDPTLTPEKAAQFGVIAADKETILRESDYLSLLCPLLPSTRKMLGMAEFKKMKPTAILINTGRGELVDEQALVEALRTGVIAYAGIDVFGEINVFDANGFNHHHPLFSLENALLTPHVAANSEEALAVVNSEGAEAVVDVLSGKAPLHPVNPEVKPWFQNNL